MICIFPYPSLSIPIHPYQSLSIPIHPYPSLCLFHLRTAGIGLELKSAKQDLPIVIANEWMARKALLISSCASCGVRIDCTDAASETEPCSLASTAFALTFAASSQASPWTSQPCFLSPSPSDSPSPASSSMPQPLGRSAPAPPPSGPWASP